MVIRGEGYFQPEKGAIQMGFLRIFAFVLTVGTLAACGEPTKQDIIKDAEGADTKAQLENALGSPTEVSKLGPIEKWVYKAADGTVVFVITGDSVSLQSAN